MPGWGVHLSFGRFRDFDSALKGRGLEGLRFYPGANDVSVGYGG
jgi:hypothetical protein